MTPVINLKNVDIEVGKQSILTDLSLTISSPSRTAVLGRNGAGKSTLLKALIGIHSVTSGTITVDGRDLSEMTPAEIARHIAYLPQKVSVQLPFLVRDIVAMGLYCKGSSVFDKSAIDTEFVRSILIEFGIDALQHRRFSELSGGEQQKVLLASTFAQRADCIALDEPTTFLDPIQERNFFELLEKSEASRPCAVIIVTHDIERAFSWADRIIGIRDGSVIGDFPHDSFVERREEILRSIYE